MGINYIEYDDLATLYNNINFVSTIRALQSSMELRKHLVQTHKLST